MTKRFSVLLAGAVLAGLVATLPAHAADTGTKEGTVWNIWYGHVDDANVEGYLTSLGKSYRYQLEAWKKAGMIVDYLIITSPINSPQDWNFSVMVELDSFAKLDIPHEKWDEIARKALESVKGTGKSAENLAVQRTVVSKRIAREIVWKDQ